MRDVQLIVDAATLAKICQRKVEDVDEFAIGAAPPFNATYNKGRHILNFNQINNLINYPELTSAATNESSALAATASAKRSLCFEEPQELRDATSTATADSDEDVLASLSDEIDYPQNSKSSKSGN